MPTKRPEGVIGDIITHTVINVVGIAGGNVEGGVGGNSNVRYRNIKN